jgi:hypothetical protein
MQGFHFTSHYSVHAKKTSTMWVCAADGYNTEKYTQAQIAGLFTGIVFTEIDHNYVNLASNAYKKELNAIMGNVNRANWLKPDGDALLYEDGYKVFNEYMTHALYLLYTNTILAAQDQAVIERHRVELMQNRRKYHRFEAFYGQLAELYANKRQEETITHLYPKIIEWCTRQNQAEQ